MAEASREETKRILGKASKSKNTSGAPKTSLETEASSKGRQRGLLRHVLAKKQLFRQLSLKFLISGSGTGLPTDELEYRRGWKNHSLLEPKT